MDHLFCHDCKAKCLKMYELFHHFIFFPFFCSAVGGPKSLLGHFLRMDMHRPPTVHSPGSLFIKTAHIIYLSWVKFKIVSEVF